jgi:hypothetical protein
MLRSILAIVAGFVAIAVLSIGTSVALAAAGIFPDTSQPTTDTGLLMLTLAYVAVYAIAGCYLAAVLAPNRPMRHALILGVLGLAFNLISGLSLRGQFPNWYLVAGVLTTMPYAWIGGLLREFQLDRGRAPGLAAS